MKDWTGNSRSTFTTLGARNYALNEREEHDYYATEPKALELLLDRETFSPRVWECACGEGHLSKVLEARGYEVRSTDLIDRGFGEGGVDFLEITEPWDGDIITNPPYRWGKEFVAHALELIPEGKKAAFFLKVQFLESVGRRKLFDSTPPPQNCGIVLSATLCLERKLGNRDAKQRRELCVVYMGKGL